jgi:hypothetical protein
MDMPRQIKTEEDREDKRAYDREWYRLHSEQVRVRNAEQRRTIRQWYVEYKETLCCQQCGENHPATLVFHHRNQLEKEFSIAEAVHDGWSVARIQQEIKKCDVLCTNCHKRIHRHRVSEIDP